MEQPASFFFFFFFYSVFPDSFLSLFWEAKWGRFNLTLLSYFWISFSASQLFTLPSLCSNSQPTSLILSHLSSPSLFPFPPSPLFFFFFGSYVAVVINHHSVCFVARNRHADRQRGRQKDKQAHEEWKTILYEDTEKQTEVRGLRGPDWDGSEQKSIRDTLFLECNPSGLLLA